MHSTGSSYFFDDQIFLSAQLSETDVAFTDGVVGVVCWKSNDGVNAHVAGTSLTASRRNP